LKPVQWKKRRREEVLRLTFSVEAVLRRNPPWFKIAVLLVEVEQQALIKLSRSVHQVGKSRFFAGGCYSNEGGGRPFNFLVTRTSLII